MTEYRQQIKVTLTDGERYLYAFGGTRRQCINLYDKNHDRDGLRDNAAKWFYHINGCCGEGACAKGLDLYLDDPVGRKHKVDVGRIFKVEARSTEWPNGKLRVNRDDNPESAMVLCLGQAMYLDWILAGWMYAKDAQANPNWYESLGRTKAFWVPQGYLRPMGELELIIARKRFEWVTSLQSSNIISGRFGQGSSPHSQG